MLRNNYGNEQKEMSSERGFLVNEDGTTENSDLDCFYFLRPSVTEYFLSVPENWTTVLSWD